MSEVSIGVDEGSETSSAIGAFASLDNGFLGTGYSSSVELSFIVMALIVVYVANGTFRYFLPDFSLLRTITSAIGLADR